MTKDIILQAIKEEDKLGIYIQKIHNKTGASPKQIKNTINTIKEFIKNIADKNNVSIDEVINNPEKYGVFGPNNKHDTK